MSHTHAIPSLVPLGVCPSWFIGRAPEYHFDTGGQALVAHTSQLRRGFARDGGPITDLRPLVSFYFWSYAIVTAAVIAFLFLRL